MKDDEERMRKLVIQLEKLQEIGKLTSEGKRHLEEIRALLDKITKR